MLKRIGTMTLALSLFLATGAAAQIAGEVSGTVEHVEPGTGIVKFTDGRIVHLAPGSRVWIDGREVALTELRPGSRLVVRSQAAAPSVSPPAAIPGGAAGMAGHPPINAFGTVARVDQRTGVITFQDGRSVKTTDRTTVWQPLQIGGVQPGTQLFVDGAVPVGFQSTAGAQEGRIVMGTVTQVDPGQALVVLNNGTVVRVSPETPMRMGQENLTITQLQPGDQLVIRVRERQAAAAGAVPSAVGSTAVGGVTSGAASPSALPREGFYGASIDAADVLIIRRNQAP
jgi:hypothetical protein